MSSGAAPAAITANRVERFVIGTLFLQERANLLFLLAPLGSLGTKSHFRRERGPARSAQPSARSSREASRGVLSLTVCCRDPCGFLQPLGDAGVEVVGLRVPHSPGTVPKPDPAERASLLSKLAQEGSIFGLEDLVELRDVPIALDCVLASRRPCHHDGLNCGFLRMDELLISSVDVAPTISRNAVIWSTSR